MIKVNGFNSSFYLDLVSYPNRQKLIQEIEDRYHEEPTHKPDSWEENVHTSIQYEGHKNNLEYFQNAGIPLDLVYLIDEKIQNLVRKENLNDMGLFYISEMWYNAYKNGQYQHKHKHSNRNNNFFSGVYYIQFDENEHSPTRFYNPYFEIDFDKVKNHSFFVYTPKIKEDDLLIFPSDVGHDVSYQYSSKLRITISFNVSCIFNESKQYF
jgi:uncharacterized protein (TIGR02466 family)